MDFYLDGKFHRSEGYPPFELDGGAATGLSNGPHELRAVLQFKDGSKPMTLTSTFDAGKPPLRCSSDAVVDGNDPGLRRPHVQQAVVDLLVAAVRHQVHRFLPGRRIPPYRTLRALGI